MLANSATGPRSLLFAAFQFDPEAAKDIDELDPAKTKLLFLRSQMNTDLLTEDLKKKRSSNESFWLVGQPDVELRQVKAGRPQGQVAGRDSRVRLLQPANRDDRIGRHKQSRHVALGHRLRRAKPVSAAGFFPMAGRKTAGRGWRRASRRRSTKS